MTDDDLAEVVRAALRGRDPVPAAVVAAARHSFAWRDLDARLAELTADSAGELATVRGAGPRLLTFEAPGRVVEIEVERVGGRLRIAGQLVPPHATRVRVQQPGAQRDTASDGLGRFAVDDLAPGATRVAYEAEDGPVVTAWMIL